MRGVSPRHPGIPESQQYSDSGLVVAANGPVPESAATGPAGKSGRKSGIGCCVRCVGLWQGGW
jgi:hypothetical protein